MNNRRPAPDALRREPDDRGSAAAEFAIVVPVLLLLIFTMITLSSVYFDQLRLQAAARDAARIGSVNASEACTTARSALGANDIGTLSCAIASSCTTGTVRVELTSTQNLAVPFIGDRSVTLQASSSFVCPQ